MPGFSLTEVQEAVYAALYQHVMLNGANVAVYDYVPEGTTPVSYITLGGEQSTDNDTKTEPGEDITVEIHTWSRARGKKELKIIMEQVYTLLHYRLSIDSKTGYQIVVCRQAFATTMRDPDGITNHGVQRFNIITSYEG